VAGAVGSQAIHLDGVDDWVQIGDVNISGTAPRTIAGWAKSNSMNITDWTLIFGLTGNADGSGGNGSHFNVGYSATNTINSEPSFIAHVWGWEEQILPLDVGVWHHFAMTYDGTTIQYFGDGIWRDTDPGKSNVQNLTHAGRFHVGKRVTSGLHFPGDVDEVRVYSYVLSDEEIAYLAVKGGAQLYIPLVSPANLYDNEPNGLKWINFRDHAIISGSWLDEVLWPSD
jgi:hypothetical protein